MKNRFFWLAFLAAALLVSSCFVMACDDDNDDDDNAVDDDDDTTDDDDDDTDDDDMDDDDTDDDDDNTGVKCDDPSLLPPTCLPKGKETVGDAIDDMHCSQRDELYAELPCTLKACEIYDIYYNASEACGMSSPDADMCNCLSCYRVWMACMTWQDDFDNCYDADEIFEICRKDRDVCMESYPPGHCEKIENYPLQIKADSMCFNQDACATDNETGDACICEKDGDSKESYWKCGPDVVCGE